MKTVALMFALIAAQSFTPAQPTDPPEGTPIGSAQVSGIDTDRLSPGLRDDIARLAGRPLNRDELKGLAARIEAEQPRLVAAVRILSGPAAEVRVVFVVASARDPNHDANVNDSYVIERADVRGIPDSDLPADLIAELRALAGKPVGSDDVDRVEARLKGELPGYDISRRIIRGGRTGEVRLLFRVEKSEAARWLHFEPLKSNLVYHSLQGWGAYLDLPIGGRDFRVTPIIAIDNGDDLIEEYSGFGIRVESRRLGTERLGASLEWSSFDPTWRDPTLAAIMANPHLPNIYDQRSTVTPLLTFAVTQRFRVRGGVGITELEAPEGVPGSQTANAAIASVGYTHQWELPAGAKHDADAAFEVRAASSALESDYSYTRYFGRADYQYRRSRHTLVVSGMAGGIDGTAPLFERFSLGDSRTLRGWDKYDIAPAGGDRMFHTSVEYRYQGLTFFLDSGSVWDEGTDARVRVATGFGFNAGPFFMTIGFPLNTDNVRAVFTTGIRFGGFGVRND